MWSDWGAAARLRIAKEMAKMPEGATLEDRRKALRRASGDFHMGTSWGKKVWPKECRKYLAQFGLKPTESLGTQPRRRVEDSPLFNSADHAFPFRET